MGLHDVLYDLLREADVLHDVRGFLGRYAEQHGILDRNLLAVYGLRGHGTVSIVGAGCRGFVTRLVRLYDGRQRHHLLDKRGAPVETGFKDLPRQPAKPGDQCYRSVSDGGIGQTQDQQAQNQHDHRDDDRNRHPPSGDFASSRAPYCHFIPPEIYSNIQRSASRP